MQNIKSKPFTSTTKYFYPNMNNYRFSLGLQLNKPLKITSKKKVNKYNKYNRI